MKMKNGFLAFIILVFASSCNTETKKIEEIKIAKTVPLNYVLATDTNFSSHQDTLYYQQHYFTGFRYNLFASGDTEFVTGYFNVLEEGTQKKWYSNKQIAEQHFFINGKKEGLQQVWGVK